VPKGLIAIVVAFALLLASPAAEARYSSGSHRGGGYHSSGHHGGGGHSGGHRSGGSGHSYHSHRSSSPRFHSSHSSSGRHHSTYASGAARDSHGRIKRSEKAKREFESETGYPHGRPGYVIDHVRPLADGGADDPSNMQWQTVGDAKAKDKWERGQTQSAHHGSDRRRRRRAA